MNTSLEDMPVISVIVPVYNTAPWLRRCLDSICAQTYRNLEILCVNDGSTDNSAEILEEYAAKDSRIKVFTQENAGLSAARNTALEHATGEWVTGVDSDDYLAPGICEKAISCAAAAVDMVFFGVQEVDETNAALPEREYFELPGDGAYEMTPELAAQLNVCFCGKLWRRSLLEENNLRFPHGLVHEDEALYYLAAPYVRKIAICPDLGYYYVQREGSIMNSGMMSDLNRVRRIIPVLEYVGFEYAQRGLRSRNERRYLVKMFVRLCCYCVCIYWSPEKDAIVEILGPVLRHFGLYRDNYLLERLLPVSGGQRLFLTRYPQSKVYRLFGLACWAVEYSEDGWSVAQQCPIWGKIKKMLLK